MSTPIETNTEELQEILQTVYNLPNAGGSGSAKTDLIIKTANGFAFNNTSARNISYDNNAVISTYEKLTAGNEVRVTLTGSMPLATYADYDTIATVQAERVMCHIESWNQSKALDIRFRVPSFYGHFSTDETEITIIHYQFIIYADGSVSLSGSTCWKEE